MVSDGWGSLGWAAAAVFLLVVVRWGNRDTIRTLQTRRRRTRRGSGDELDR
jgi:hypothetical protein